MSFKRHKQYRLPGYDYSAPGDYFVTICTKNRGSSFGEIHEVEGKAAMILSEIGHELKRSILATMNIYPNVQLGIFQIMPDHVHLMLTLIPIQENTPRRVPTSITNNSTLQPLKSGSVSSVVNHLKGSVTKWARNNQIEFCWQSRFHDHIIRDSSEKKIIENYILKNPERWFLKSKQPLY